MARDTRGLGKTKAQGSVFQDSGKETESRVSQAAEGMDGSKVRKPMLRLSQPCPVVIPASPALGSLGNSISGRSFNRTGIVRI